MFQLDIRPASIEAAKVAHDRRTIYCSGHIRRHPAGERLVPATIVDANHYLSGPVCDDCADAITPCGGWCDWDHDFPDSTTTRIPAGSTIGQVGEALNQQKGKA